MARTRAPRHLTTSLAVGVMLASTLGASAAFAAGDRTPPTAPSNLVVTGTTSYGVSLAWKASSDKSGIASYTICCANTNSETTNGPVTSYTYTKGIEAGRSVTLFVVARDTAGNVSKTSNTVTVTTPRDTTTPSKPTVTVTDVGPTSVSLSWSATDDSPNLWFTVTKDGSPVLTGTRDTSGTLALLQPDTSYTFTVQAMDFGGNRSPVSDPLTVTTETRDATDTTPPSTPGNLRTNGMAFSDGETWLFWDESADDQTDASLIEYQVFVNGVYDSSVVGFERQIVYGTPNSFNTYSVVAVDESGNKSAEASIVVDNR